MSVSFAMLVDGLLLLLTLVGFFISFYFTLVYYQRIPANYYLVPRVCRMKESTCQTVLSTQDARVLGIPNSALGILYYGIVLFIAVAGGWVSGGFAHRFLLWVSILVVCFSLYLTYSLLFRIRIVCPLCFVTHGVNVVIALLLFIKT